MQQWVVTQVLWAVLVQWRALALPAQEPPEQELELAVPAQALTAERVLELAPLALALEPIAVELALV
jgi:hypothetical protein